MDERKITLKNVGKVPLEFTLHHDVVCATRQKCTCRTVMLAPEKKGGKQVPKRLCASVKLLPGETSDALPAAMLHLPHVKAALRRDPALVVVEDVQAKVEVI